MEKKQIKINGKIAVEIKINGGLFWKAGGPGPSEPIQPNKLVYSANAAGSTIKVNGETVTLEEGENIVLEYPSEITSVKATNNTALTYIQIPNTVTSIEGGTNPFRKNGAFASCTYLKSITIPESVTSIGTEAFYGCTSLDYINISSGMKSIGKNSFRGCTKLASVTLPDTIESISENAFYDCDKLSDFNYNGTISQWASITLGSGWCSILLMVVHCSDGYVLTEYGIPTNQGVFSTNAAGSTITVNGETVTLEHCTNCGISYANEITSINATNNTALMMIKLPNTITSIDNNSFANCISLSFIIISDSITSINENAFYGCTTLNDFIYSGTKAQWASITKGTNWNKDAAFTVVHCSDGDVNIL